MRYMGTLSIYDFIKLPATKKKVKLLLNVIQIQPIQNKNVIYLVVIENL